MIMWLVMGLLEIVLCLLVWVMYLVVDIMPALGVLFGVLIAIVVWLTFEPVVKCMMWEEDHYGC